MPFWNLRALNLIAFFLFTLAAKWQVISLFGHALPYWDEWGGVSGLLEKWVSSTLRWEDLIASHNEHRLLVPRLFWIGVFVANDGQWDPKVTQYLAAVIASLTALVIVSCYLHRSRWRSARLVLAGAAALYALPLAWMNLVWGFQAQFHFQMLFSVLAICGLSSFDPRRLIWWGGIVASVGVLFTSGSAVLFAAGLFAVIVVRWVRERSVNKEVAATAVILIALVMTAWFLLPKNSPGYRLAAQDAGQFLVALMQHFAWPWSDLKFFSVIVYMPSVLLLIRYWRQGAQTGGTELALMLAGMAAAQLLAMAYARGLNGLGPHPRYADIHLLGVMGNLLCLTELKGNRHLNQVSFSKFNSLIEHAVSLAWFAVVSSGILFLALDALTVRLPQWREEKNVMQANLLAYIKTSDESHLRSKLRNQIPAQEPEWLIEPLKSEKIRAILPYTIRVPLDLKPVRQEGGIRLKGAIPVSDNDRQFSWDYYSSYDKVGALGQLKSAPLNSNFPCLVFDYAGFGTGSNIALCATALHSQRKSCLSMPEADANERGWRQAILRIPREPFTLTALDDRPGGWLAFSLPVEAGKLTVWSFHFNHVANVFLALSATLFLLLLYFTKPSAEATAEWS